MMINNQEDMLEEIEADTVDQAMEIFASCKYQSLEPWISFANSAVQIGVIVEESEAAFDTILKYPFAKKEFHDAFYVLKQSAQQELEEITTI